MKVQRSASNKFRKIPKLKTRDNIFDAESRQHKGCTQSIGARHRNRPRMCTDAENRQKGSHCILYAACIKYCVAGGLPAFHSYTQGYGVMAAKGL